MDNKIIKELEKQYSIRAIHNVLKEHENNKVELKDLIKKIAEKDSKYKKNLIQIDGKDQKMVNIIIEYIRTIEDGFDLTLEEIMEILDFKRNNVHNKIRYEVQHIFLNDAVKNFFFKTIIGDIAKQEAMINIMSFFDAKKGIKILENHDMLQDLMFNGDSKIFNLFKKKVLFNRQAFYEFLADNITIIKRYKKIDLDQAKCKENIDFLKKYANAMYKKDKRFGSPDTLINSWIAKIDQGYRVEQKQNIRGIKKEYRSVQEVTFKFTDLYSVEDLKNFNFISSRIIKSNTEHKNNASVMNLIDYSATEKLDVLGGNIRYNIDLDNIPSTETVISYKWYYELVKNGYSEQRIIDLVIQQAISSFTFE